jgi:hypothetical protein
MKKILFSLILLSMLFTVGCQRGDFQASMVVEGQIAPHDGYNIGPDLYVEKGDPIPVSGVCHDRGRSK